MRNCESLIRETANSILYQDFPHEYIEVIFVDDGSEDKTMTLILNFISKIDMQARVYSSKWMGLGAARQTIVDNAEGKYIIWVDGGMILSKDFVRRQVEFMEKNQDAGIAKGKYGVVNDRSIVFFLKDVGDMMHFLRDGGSFKEIGRKTSKLPGTGGSICRVEAIRQVGGFDRNIKGAGEDTDVAYRIRAAGWTIYVTDATFYKKRKETQKELWDHYLWYGYGLHYVLHKLGYKGIFSPHKMTPIAGFVEGLLYSSIAYKLTHRKTVFLLPMYYVYKRIALCIGFSKSHQDSYGHVDYIAGSQEIK